MMNLLRADIYAMLRGKTLYITFGLLFLFNSLMIILQVVGSDVTIGIHLEGIDGLDAAVLNQAFNGMNSAAYLFTQTNNMAFFLLALIILASAPIFSQGTVKNDIAWGISRTKLYVAKLINATGLCILMVICYVGTGMALATALQGWGGAVPDGYWVIFLQTLGAQTLMLMALTCIGVFLMFTFKRVSVVNGVYIAFCLVPAILVLSMLESNINVAWLLEFDIMLGIGRLGFFSQLDTRSISIMLGISAFYIFAATFAGILLFRRAEIK
jgi:hypothetical protein